MALVATTGLGIAVLLSSGPPGGPGSSAGCFAGPRGSTTSGQATPMIRIADSRVAMPAMSTTRWLPAERTGRAMHPCIRPDRLSPGSCDQASLNPTPAANHAAQRPGASGSARRDSVSTDARHPGCLRLVAAIGALYRRMLAALRRTGSRAFKDDPANAADRASHAGIRWCRRAGGRPRCKGCG